jgi:hypothetical protein
MIEQFHREGIVTLIYTYWINPLSQPEFTISLLKEENKLVPTM